MLFPPGKKQEPDKHTSPKPYWFTVTTPEGQVVYEVGFARRKIATFYDRGFAVTFYEWLCNATSERIAELLRHG